MSMLTEEEIRELAGAGETLTVEFKGEEREATAFLKALVSKGKLVALGERRGRYYQLPGNQGK